jgi:hypothetical protein
LSGWVSPNQFASGSGFFFGNDGFSGQGNSGSQCGIAVTEVTHGRLNLGFGLAVLWTGRFNFPLQSPDYRWRLSGRPGAGCITKTTTTASLFAVIQAGGFF